MGNLGGLAGLLLFPALVWAVSAFFPASPPGLAPGEVEKERLKRLAAVNQEQNERVTSSAWIDQSANKVRIPVSQAANLVLPELRSGAPKPSSLIVPGRAVAVPPPGESAPAEQAPAPVKPAPTSDAGGKPGPAAPSPDGGAKAAPQGSAPLDKGGAAPVQKAEEVKDAKAGGEVVPPEKSGVQTAPPEKPAAEKPVLPAPGQ